MAAEYDATPQEVRQFVLVQLLLTAGFLGLLTWMFGALDSPAPPIWMWVVLLLAVVVGAVLAERVWLSTEPLPADVERPHETAVGIYAGQSVRKLAFCEAPILLGVVFSFVVDHAAWPLLIAGVPGLLVLAFETWPTARNLSLVEQGLEADGVETRLLEDFHS